MTVTQVRLLSDGEELVIEDGQWQSPGSSELPPGEALFARRSQAIFDDDRLVLWSQQAQASRRPEGRARLIVGTETSWPKPLRSS